MRPNDHLHQIFKDRQKELGLKNTQLAKRLRVSYGCLAMIRHHTPYLRMDQYFNFCQALDLDPVKVMQQLTEHHYETTK